jgi:hypothetical protein
VTTKCWIHSLRLIVRTVLVIGAAWESFPGLIPEKSVETDRRPLPEDIAQFFHRPSLTARRSNKLSKKPADVHEATVVNAAQIQHELLQDV